MSIISEIQIVDRPSSPTAVVRGEGIPFEELRGFFDSAFEVLGAAIQRGDLVPTGPAFALYRSTPPEPLNLEVGFPVAVGFTEGGSGDAARVEAGELPGGRCATATLRGGYDLLSQAWEEFMEGTTAQGVTPGMPYWEIYLTMPTPEGDPAEPVTELVIPIS